jgi:hypothetical protein
MRHLPYGRIISDASKRAGSFSTVVYNRTQYPELVTVVRDSDAVPVPNGFHPNVSFPGHRICSLWATGRWLLIARAGTGSLASRPTAGIRPAIVGIRSWPEKVVDHKIC